jgi:hypothetical protein
MTEYDYNMKINTPVTYTVEEWELKQEMKAIEIDQYNSNMDKEELPF